MAARRLSKKMYKNLKFQDLQQIPKLQNMNYEIYKLQIFKNILAFLVFLYNNL